MKYTVPPLIPSQKLLLGSAKWFHGSDRSSFIFLTKKPGAGSKTSVSQPSGEHVDLFLGIHLIF